MSRPQFHVATWLSCFLLHSMSRPQKHVTTSFLLSATTPWSQLPFLCCDLNCLSVHYLVATWDLGHDLIVSFLAEIYVATLKACRDINSAYPVATSLLSHNIFNFTTHFYCCDMNSRLRPRFVFSAYIFFVTSILVCYQLCLLLRRDLEAVSRHEGWLFLSMLLSQLLKCMSRHEFLVATLIGISNLYLCRNLKLPGRDIASPFSITFWSRHHFSVATNNIFFSCRDLKTVSRHYLP